MRDVRRVQLGRARRGRGRDRGGIRQELFGELIKWMPSPLRYVQGQTFHEMGVTFLQRKGGKYDF